MYDAKYQFPVRPVFAKTKNKVQGQTFEFIEVDLSISIFMSGMIYVAFSQD